MRRKVGEEVLKVNGVKEGSLFLMIKVWGVRLSYGRFRMYRECTYFTAYSQIIELFANRYWFWPTLRRIKKKKSGNFIDSWKRNPKRQHQGYREGSITTLLVFLCSLSQSSTSGHYRRQEVCQRCIFPASVQKLSMELAFAGSEAMQVSGHNPEYNLCSLC